MAVDEVGKKGQMHKVISPDSVIQFFDVLVLFSAAGKEEKICFCILL